MRSTDGISVKLFVCPSVFQHTRSSDTTGHFGLQTSVNSQHWSDASAYQKHCIEFYIFFLPALDSIGINVKV